MSAKGKGGLVVGLVLGLVAGIALAMSWGPASFAGAAEGKKASGAPHYTVVETEGHNLLVLDNQTNIFYFYTVDKGKEVGSDLKLRGTLDLNEVGKPVLTPKKAKQDE